MFDNEGSRSEFLKILAECGEEPAFVARGLAPQIALDALLRACEQRRNEMLKWPKIHLSMLAHRIQCEWPRVAELLVIPESVSLLETLHESLHADTPAQANWLASNRAVLRDFLESAERFNRHWLAYVDGLDLESVNQPRRDYNEFYVLEKSCAFGSETITEGFVPLTMIDIAYLHDRFPLLTIPSLA